MSKDDESGDDPRSLREKRQYAAGLAHDARRANAYHPLFDYSDGENAKPVDFINLRRFEQSGPVDCMTIYAGSDLVSAEDIFNMWGGGMYHLTGRTSTPNGQPGPIVKQKKLKLPGASKPFVSQQTSEDVEGAPAAASAHAPVGANDPMMMFMHIMQQQQQAAERREERRAEEMRAEARERAARDDARATATSNMIVQGLTVVAGVITAVIGRPTPTPPDLTPLFARLIPEPGSNDPIAKLKDVIEVAGTLKGNKGDNLAEIAQAVGNALQGMGQIETARVEAAKAGLVPVTAQAGAALQPPAQVLPAPPPAHANGGTLPAHDIPIIDGPRPIHPAAALSS